MNPDFERTLYGGTGLGGPFLVQQRIPASPLGTVTATLIGGNVALSWNEVLWAITGPNVVWETFKTKDEAIQRAKILVAKTESITEVLVLKVVHRVRPVPKEVEVVDVAE